MYLEIIHNLWYGVGWGGVGELWWYERSLRFDVVYDDKT